MPDLVGEVGHFVFGFDHLNRDEAVVDVGVLNHLRVAVVELIVGNYLVILRVVLVNEIVNELVWCEVRLFLDSEVLVEEKLIETLLV